MKHPSHWCGNLYQNMKIIYEFGQNKVQYFLSPDNDYKIVENFFSFAVFSPYYLPHPKKVTHQSIDRIFKFILSMT